MTCDPYRKDWYFAKNKYQTAHGGSYLKLDNSRRTTYEGGCSPRDAFGRLLLQQNRINRVFVRESGVPGVQVVIQGGSKALGSTFGYIEPDLPSKLRAYEQSLAIALSRFKKKAQYKAMLMQEYIRERKRIYTAFSHAVAELRYVALQLAKRKFKTVFKYSVRAGKMFAKRVEMTFHEKWLAYHFAVVPMMEDFKKNIHNLPELHNGLVRVSSTWDSYQDATDRNWINSSYVYRLYKLKTTITGSVGVEDPLEAVKSLMGLNTGDFYDIIPFSFVVDWFLNAGQIIKGIDVPGLTYYDTSVTTLEKDHLEFFGEVRPSLSAVTKYSQIGGTYYTSRAQYVRDPGPLPEIPVVFKGGVNSLWRSITTLALIRTIFQKK